MSRRYRVLNVSWHGKINLSRRRGRHLRSLICVTVYRMPVFLSSHPNWVPQPPHPQASVAVLSFGSKGGHTRLWERGGGSQFGRKDRHLVLYRHSIIPLRSVPSAPQGGPRRCCQVRARDRSHMLQKVGTTSTGQNIRDHGLS
jgi:hypothetical protein